MEGGAATVVSVVSDMISDIAGDLTGLITDNVPVIAPILGGMIVLGFGVKFAKRLFAKA